MLFQTDATIVVAGVNIIRIFKLVDSFLHSASVLNDFMKAEHSHQSWKIISRVLPLPVLFHHTQYKTLVMKMCPQQEAHQNV
jgi:hypothetical protein